MGSAAPPSAGDLSTRAERLASGSTAPAPRRIGAFPLIHENPYQELLYGALSAYGFEVDPEVEFKLRSLWRSRGRLDVLHFHWPQNYYSWWRRPVRLRHFLSWLKLPIFAARLVTARALGFRVVWTIHEAAPHEGTGRRIDRIGSRILASACHALIAHDTGTVERARVQLGLPPERISIVPHGFYLGVYPAGRARDVVRAELGLPTNSFTFLCFGHIRAYKETDALLAAFARVQLANVALVVAGLPLDEASAASIREAAARDPRIIPMLEFVHEERVAELFGACDAAVQTRSDGGTSGALVLALSMGLPVVTAAVHDYAELIGGDEAGWTYAPRDVDSLTDALERAAQDLDVAHAKGEAALRRAHLLGWPEIARRTAEIIFPPR